MPPLTLYAIHYMPCYATIITPRLRCRDDGCFDFRYAAIALILLFSCYAAYAMPRFIESPRRCRSMLLITRHDAFTTRYYLPEPPRFATPLLICHILIAFFEAKRRHARHTVATSYFISVPPQAY